MTEKQWVLTDVADGIWLDDFDLDPQDGPSLAGATNWSVQKRTLQGGVSAGVDVVEVDNGRLTMSILPTRGMGLWKGACDGLGLGWNSPVPQPVNPAFVNQSDRSGLGWLSGFNELLCRCGLSSNGAPGTDVIKNNEGNPTETELTLHGKIANTPAHHVAVSISDTDAGTISVTGIVDETMMFGPSLQLVSTFSTTAGSNSFSIIDEVRNLQGTPAELELLYHTNFGKPLLEEGAQLVAPILEMAPRDAHAAADLDSYDVYLGPTAGYVEQCYFFELAADEAGQTRVLLRNRAGDRGLSMRYAKSQLPWLTQWKCTQLDADGYVTGIEPGTDFPNLKTFEREQGRVVVLPPGGSYQVRIDFEIHGTAEAVAAMEHEISALQEHFIPKVHRSPYPKYCGS